MMIALALLFSGPALPSVATVPAPILHRAAMADDISARILKVHNRYRASVGARPLQWSTSLALSAGAHGPVLASLGKLVHSAREGRRGQSENLWLGTRGRYTVEAMVEYWAEERRHMRAGIFPNVSTTRDWQDVSHYTTMIWPDTTHVGCHLQHSRMHDVLICRYSPKANQDGRVVGR